MMDPTGTIAVCSLCLGITESFKKVDEVEWNMLNDVLPGLCVTPQTDVCICDICLRHLQESYNFRRSCLETNLKTERLLKSKEVVLVNMGWVSENDSEHIIIKEEGALQKRCLCCGRTDEKELNTSISEEDIRQMLARCVPKLQASYLARSPTMCKRCLPRLEATSTFINSCLEGEEDIKNFCAVSPISSDSYIISHDLPSLKVETEAIKDGIEVHFEKVLNDPPVELKTGRKVTDEIVIRHEETDTAVKNFFKLEDKNHNKLDPSLLVQDLVTATRSYSCENYPGKENRQNDSNSKQKVKQTNANLKVFRCYNCPFTSKNKWSLRCHIMRVHTKEVMYKCKTCSYETTYKHHLERHQKVHKSPTEMICLKCDHCTFQTYYKKALHRHMSVHYYTDSSKPRKKVEERRNMLGRKVEAYQCHKCDYKTNKKHYLRCHMPVHSEVKYYACEKCAYKGKSKRNLLRHMLTHKETWERRTFKCSVCQYETKVKKCLEIHVMRVHTDPIIMRKPAEPKKFKCDLCEFRTARRRNLTAHVASRHGQKIERRETKIEVAEDECFKCDLCEFQTKYRREITTHNQWVHYRDVRSVFLKKVTRNEVFKCASCDYETKYKRDLETHMVLSHQNKP